MIAQGFQSIVIPRQMQEAERLLQSAGLSLPQGTDAGIGCYEDGVLVGAGFLAGNLLCGLCVEPTHRGEGVAAGLVGRLVALALERGHARVCVDTKASEADKFVDQGFSLVAATADAAMLERGSPLYAQWAAEAARSIRAALGQGPAAEVLAQRRLGAVVMNANPFTLGHRELARRALEEAGAAVVFVVEEEASAFPFAMRLGLVRAGLADLPGVAVLAGGPYMVSRASFPSYFTGAEAHAAVHAGLDAAIFATRIAPDLGISRRYVGEEPLCPVTALYNATLAQVLPRHGVALVEIPRLQQGAEVVSASRVRQLMRAPDYADHPERFAGLVPPSTQAALLSEQGQAVARTLRQRASRH